MLDRLGKLLDPDEFEAALSAALAAMALDPAIPAAYAAYRAGGRRAREEKQEKRKRSRLPAESFREERGDGWFRPHPAHPWLDPAATGDGGHVPARPAAAVDGKERKLAKARGRKKVHLLAAAPTSPAWSSPRTRRETGKANEVTHFRPLLEPLPLDGVLITSDASRRPGTTPCSCGKPRRRITCGRSWAQPNLNAQLNALPWETTPVTAATSEISRGRIETRTIRARAGRHRLRGRCPGRPHRALHHLQEERPVAPRARRLDIASLAAEDAPRRPAGPRPRPLAGGAHARLRDVIWKEDKSLIRTGPPPRSGPPSPTSSSPLPHTE